MTIQRFMQAFREGWSEARPSEASTVVSFIGGAAVALLVLELFQR